MPSGAVGTLVSSLVDFASPAGQVDNVTDVDSGALLGIAVTAADTANGSWYYSTNDGTNWNALGAVASNNARLLAADANTRLYFQPNANYHGTLATALTFRAWDQSSGSNGTLADTTSNGGNTGFSTATDTASLVINPLADTPSVTNATTNEDTQTTSGLVISRNAADGTEVTHFKITGVTNGTLYQNDGTTQISNGTFITFAQGNAGLKFTPTTDFNGNGSFTLQASTANGDAGLGGSTVDATITVNAVNDAPVLDNSQSPALNAQNEDSGAPSGAVGTLVSALVDFASPAGQVDNVTDVDSGAVLGIAVTAADTTNGSWYYSTDNGTNWNALGAVANNSARLLAADADTRLYFQPNADYHGALATAITFRAWDQTSGAGGTLADTTSNGGTTAFSTATDTASLVINPLADTPSVTNATTNENTQTTSGLVISRNAADGAEVTHFKITGISNGTLYQNDGTTQITNGTFITFAQGNAGLKFTPTTDFNGSGNFTVQASTANGDAGLGGSTVVATITVNAVNDAPVLDNTKSPTLTAQNEDAGVPSGAVGTLVSALVDFASPAGQVDNVTDVDSGAALGIAVTAADTANGSWYYSTDNGTNWNALGAVASNNARLLAADADTRLYFQPNADYSGTLASAISFRAWDQTSGTAGTLADTTSNGGTTAFSTTTDAASLTITAVNDAPVLDNSQSPTLTAQNEDSGAPSGAVGTLVSSLVDFASPAGQVDNVTDVDSGALLGIAVTAADTANGSWYYSTNDGTNWNALGAVASNNCATAGRRCQHAALLPAQRQLPRHAGHRPHLPGLGSEQRQ